jgi:hypothetical protein
MSSARCKVLQYLLDEVSNLSILLHPSPVLALCRPAGWHRGSSAPIPFAWLAATQRRLKFALLAEPSGLGLAGLLRSSSFLDPCLSRTALTTRISRSTTSRSGLLMQSLHLLYGGQ